MCTGCYKSLSIELYLHYKIETANEITKKNSDLDEYSWNFHQEYEFLFSTNKSPDLNRQRDTSSRQRFECNRTLSITIDITVKDLSSSQTTSPFSFKPFCTRF
ncbi:6270_t:CDS:2 [Funneliformis geosporum]|uniref:6270_t:CDS:1 n=1 Tax=Funneliformis geosporum TaxID=1117311 RepID=A0A9W4SWH5_9GLOM|nr:6270_t:CDS:2 [Funneliformis geosporum]